LIFQPTACNSVLLFQSDRHKFVAKPYLALFLLDPLSLGTFFIQCNLINLFLAQNIVSEMQKRHNVLKHAKTKMNDPARCVEYSKSIEQVVALLVNL